MLLLNVGAFVENLFNNLLMKMVEHGFNVHHGLLMEIEIYDEMMLIFIQCWSILIFKVLGWVSEAVFDWLC